MRAPLRRLTGRSGSAVGAWASLAPLVDLLTILLVFLLKTWSADPPVRPDDPSFALPVSSATDPARPLRAVDVTESGIFLDGHRLAGSRYYREHDAQRIPELYEALRQQNGPVQLRVDADQPYGLLRKALFTAQEAGVRDLTLVSASHTSLVVP